MSTSLHEFLKQLLGQLSLYDLDIVNVFADCWMLCLQNVS